VRRLLVAAAVLAAVAAAAPAARATEWSAGYSGLRESGDFVHGAALGARWRTGSALRLALEATAHSGAAAGETRRELALLAGAELAPWHGSRFSPFVSVKGGAVGSSRHVEVFGVSISPTGVCNGSCGYEVGPAAEAGGGVDVRLAGRWALRLPEAEYRIGRIAGTTERGLRLSAGLVWR
jgi:hypothetical protein